MNIPVERQRLQVNEKKKNTYNFAYKTYSLTVSKLEKLKIWRTMQILCCQDVEQLELLYTAGGDVKWCSRYGKQCAVLQKVNNRITLWSSSLTSGYTSNIIEVRISKIYPHSRVHCIIVNNSQDTETIWMSIDR